MDIISVVLGADTKKDRTRDSIKIIEYAFTSYKMVDVGYMLHEEFDKIVQKTEFEIKKGITNEIKLDLEENDIKLYPVKKEKVKDVKIRNRDRKRIKCPSYSRKQTTEK